MRQTFAHPMAGGELCFCYFHWVSRQCYGANEWLLTHNRDSAVYRAIITMLQDSIVSSKDIAQPLAVTAFLCALASLCWGITFYVHMSKSRDPSDARRWLRVRPRSGCLVPATITARFLLTQFTDRTRRVYAYATGGASRSCSHYQ